MKCPVDGAELGVQTYEAAIQVDVCPTCHGMWLDEGELEAIQKTVERDYYERLQRYVNADRFSQVKTFLAMVAGVFTSNKQ